MSNDLANNKKAAVQFLELVTSGRIEEAYKQFVDFSGKHHNPFFAAGFSALRKAMIENHEKFPAKKYTVKNVIGDGDLVAVHAQLSLSGMDRGMIVVHMARFKGSKIIELWDCGQQLPEDSPNTDGAF
ncbi:MAG TPA: ester cyclase [Candidatus Kryptonia bacterium]